MYLRFNRFDVVVLEEIDPSMVLMMVNVNFNAPTNVFLNNPTRRKKIDRISSASLN